VPYSLLGVAAGAWVVGCAKPPPSGLPPTGAVEVATEFWARLGRRDNAAAVELATYPFDLDGFGCVPSAPALVAALAEQPIPPGLDLVVRDARPVDATTALEPKWATRMARFSSPDAACLDVEAFAAGRVSVVWVDFTVGTESVGALTRVVCGDPCRVSGIDN
jgi:hypothetical protein